MEIPERFKVFEEHLAKQHAHFWVKPERKELIKDMAEYGELPRGVRRRIKMALHCLTKSEECVCDNLGVLLEKIENVVRHGKILEGLFGFQKSMEFVHFQSYDLIDKCMEYEFHAGDLIQLDMYVRAHIDAMGCYDLKYCDDREQSENLAKALMRNILAEGVLFLSMFLMFHNMRRQGIMTECVHVNDSVALDETSHCLAQMDLYKVLCQSGDIERLSLDQVREICEDFIRCEDLGAGILFGQEDMPSDSKLWFLDLTEDNVKLHVRWLVNDILEGLGYERLFPDNAGVSPLAGLVSKNMVHTSIDFFGQKSPHYGFDVKHEVSYDSDPEFD